MDYSLDFSLASEPPFLLSLRRILGGKRPSKIRQKGVKVLAPLVALCHVGYEQGVDAIRTIRFAVTQSNSLQVGTVTKDGLKMPQAESRTYIRETRLRPGTGKSAFLKKINSVFSTLCLYIKDVEARAAGLQDLAHRSCHPESTKAVTLLDNPRSSIA